jgi:hypothetical protein
VARKGRTRERAGGVGAARYREEEGGVGVPTEAKKEGSGGGNRVCEEVDEGARRKTFLALNTS